MRFVRHRPSTAHSTSTAAPRRSPSTPSTTTRVAEGSTTSSRCAGSPTGSPGTLDREADPLRIALFITCYNDLLYPEVGQAIVRLLRRLGHEVEFPQDQTCCGQIHFTTGYRD